MTDAEKLGLIEKIAREAFADKWYDVPRYKVDAHRTQALANILALFIYDGATLLPAAPVPPVVPGELEVIIEDGQITFDDILEG